MDKSTLRPHIHALLMQGRVNGEVSQQLALLESIPQDLSHSTGKLPGFHTVLSPLKVTRESLQSVSSVLGASPTQFPLLVGMLPLHI